MELDGVVDYRLDLPAREQLLVLVPVVLTAVIVWAQFSAPTNPLLFMALTVVDRPVVASGEVAVDAVV